jgi:translation initiation factor 1A
MPPNKKGGKNYKKGKHMDDEPVLFDRQEGQIYGRVIKLLGGCNVMVFCNDGRERLCHICGSMRKKVWIAPGDIVLLSLRDFYGDNPKQIQLGDICAKYDSRVFQRLMEKDTTINPLLFKSIDKINTSNVPDYEGFVFDSDESDNNLDNVPSRTERSTHRSKLLDIARANKEAKLGVTNENDTDLEQDGENNNNQTQRDLTNSFEESALDLDDNLNIDDI